MTTDRLVYPTGAVVRASVYLRNTDSPPVDVTLTARVISNLGHQTNQLAPSTLSRLTGFGWLRLEWDSAGLPPGPYTLEVSAFDPQGLFLDDSSTEFNLAQAQGRITGFDLNPREFRYGGDVDLSATFANTGSTTLSGNLLIAIRDGAGNPVAEFRRDFTDLAPGNVFRFDTVWTNATLTPRNTLVLVRAEFDGQTAELPLDATGLRLPLRWESTSAASGVVTLRWFSVSGRRYTIEFTPDLSAPFTPLITDLPATPPLNRYEHKAELKAGFYRLIEL